MFAILVLLAFCGDLASVAALPPEEGPSNCSKKYAESARYNETLQKCVVEYRGGCSPTETEDYQCGSGEGGFCRDGQCVCRASHSVLFLSIRNESGDPSDLFYDYTCLPRVGFGETCAFTPGLGGISCVNTLSCVNSTCVCEGEWDAEARVCRNDEWCSTGIAEDGLTYTWIGGTFYEKATRSCKCEPGRPCKELDGGNAGPEKCPLHSEFQPNSDSGEPGRCECEAGYTSLGLDNELRQRNPSTPDTYCVPQGLVGQPCTIGWSSTGTCSPGMECAGEGDAAVCMCPGDWSEVDKFCYSQRSCDRIEPRPVDWYLPWVFYQEGDMHCTCLLGAACPFAAGNQSSRVTCPDNSTIKTWTGPEERPFCACDDGLTPAAGSKACVPKPGYGEACQDVGVQGGKRFQPCAGGAWCSYSGKCTCSHGKIWVDSTGKCTPSAGQSCTAEEGCVANAECGADNRCACLQGFYSDGYGRICQPEGVPGARCSSDVDCNHFTECVQKPGSQYKNDQECSCQGDWNATESLCHGQRHCRAVQGTGATYESESGICKCNIGAICELGAVKQENCPPGARPTEAMTSCECEEGHTPLNKGEQCVPARKFGEVCEHSDPHYWRGMAIVPVGQCMNGSWCHDGVCKCHAPTSMWNNVLGSCVLKSGAYCEARDVCTPNTKCESWSCTCPEAEGFRATPSGECFGGHGAVCHDNGNCARGLECMDGQCACRSVAGQFYYPESGKCVSRVGAHCDPYSNNTAWCPPESTCDITTSKCECESGRVPAQNGARCFKALKYGENCTSNDCDMRKGLACKGEGRCACADLDLVYHEGQGACLAPLGSRCGNYKVPGSCIPMTEAETGERPECEHYVLACESGLECHGNEGGDGTGKVCRTRRVGTADGSAPTGNSD